MKSVLYLVHRIPYPPNKGDKIRSFNILKYLARNYHVYLGAFIDTQEDYEYIEKLKIYTKDYKIINLNKRIKTLFSLTGFISGTPLTLPYFYNISMRNWVEKITDSVDLTNIIVFSSPMAQYVTDDRFSKINKVMDFVDVDSEKWSEYSKKKSWPVSLVYQRESEYLLDYEKKIVKQFNKCLFVSKEESGLFINKLDDPLLIGKVDYFYNGVDTEYFNNTLKFNNPFNDSDRVIVFTGAMDYWANVDAVKWFVDNIFSHINKDFPDIKFYIVGGNPSKEVLRLGESQGVTVVGRVADIRPYIKNADLIVAPMRIARGIQNKVLEALAMAKPVVLTSAAAEGICASSGEHYLICDSIEEYRQQCLDILGTLESPFVSQIGKNAEKLIRQNYSWSKQLERFGGMLV